MSYGRRKIFTDEAGITAENVVREVNAVFWVHTGNRNENLQQAYNRSKVRLALVLYCSTLVFGQISSVRSQEHIRTPPPSKSDSVFKNYCSVLENGTKKHGRITLPPASQ